MEEETNEFSQFLVERLRERGFNVKRLSELSGIAAKHIENLLKGNISDLPSAPYLRGYFKRLGQVLGFDAEPWWEKMRSEAGFKDPGPDDRLPQNRFVKKFPVKAVWLAALALIILTYIGFRFTRISGQPQINVLYPKPNLINTTSSEITVSGIVTNADTLYLNGEETTIASDGSWRKSILLQSGLNTVEIKAKKLLGQETDVIKQIIYQPPAPSVPSIPGIPSL